MKKVKSIFNNIMLSFVFVGLLFCGIFLYSNSPSKNRQIIGADFVEDSIIANADLPEYFMLPQASDDIKVGDSSGTLYMVKNSATLSFKMFNTVIYNTAADDTAEKGKKNYAWTSESSFQSTERQNSDANPTSYYYFDFENTITLFYNITPDELDLEHLSNYDNLLKDTKIDDFTSKPENNFYVNDANVEPLGFELKLQLNSDIQEDAKEQEGTIQLRNEGVYTMVIPYTYLYTDNGGQTFSQSIDTTLVYTFMLFDQATYLDNVSGLPANTEMSPASLIRTATMDSSFNYSRYYYYNYSGKTTDETNTKANLPVYSYDPKRFEITVFYTDIDGVATKVLFKLEYEEEDYVLTPYLMVDGQAPVALAKEDCPILYRMDENKAYITFDNIGTYDLSFSFIHKHQDKTFALPIDCPQQRMYMYGLQAYYTSSERDENDITIQKELKYVNESDSTFTEAADITSLVNTRTNNYLVDSTGNTMWEDVLTKTTDAFDMKKFGDIVPISTNQRPVRLKHDSSVTLDTAHSKMYKITLDEEGKYKSADAGTPYAGANFNDAGTYLVAAIYQYSDFRSINGTGQPLFYHVQFFYFTITNITPYVSVYRQDGTELYNNSFTNQNVIIVDESSTSRYDSQAEITLLAQDYTRNNTPFFGSVGNGINIKNFASDTYQGIHYYTDLSTEPSLSENEKYKGKAGIVIEADDENSPYHNAKFTVYCKRETASLTSSRYFTIDTNDISDIHANPVDSNNSSYILRKYLSGTSTPFTQHTLNQPMIFSWSEKASGATTYGYVKYYKLSSANYYPEDNASQLLSTLYDNNDQEFDMIPTNNYLDLSSTASWTSYTNSKQYIDNPSANVVVPGSQVKRQAGLYVLEVYDQAGNVSFDVYLLDNSSPVFVRQDYANRDNTWSVLGSNETISVSENAELYIWWGNAKGMYIKEGDNLIDNEQSNLYKKYSFDGLDNEKTNKLLYNTLKNFFDNNTTNVTNINQIEPVDKNAITSYNGTYLTVKILDFAYIKSADSSIYTRYPPENGNPTKNHYEIKYFKQNEQGEKEAAEGTYKFLVRDESNTTTDTFHSQIAFQNSPSAFTTINISSDSSQLRFYIGAAAEGGSQVDMAGYSMTGTFYNSSNGDGELIKNNMNGETASNLTYKYQYYAPVKTEQDIFLSFVPYAADGSKIATLELIHYPYTLKTETQPIEYFDGNSWQSYNRKIYYYTISEESDRTTTIFNSSDNVANSGETQTFSLARSGSSVEEGKYVIVRKYVREGGSQVANYDYYERTLTIFVDRYNVISADQEVNTEVNGETKRSLESVVGGDILVSMYSNSNQSEFNISFPSYDKDLGGLQSGSLYTDARQNDENSVLSTVFTTNKLPAAVRIPAYKYTNYYDYSRSDNSYNVYINNNLSYYGGFYIQNMDGGQVRVFSEVVFKKDENNNNVVDENESVLIKNNNLNYFENVAQAQAYIDTIKQNRSIVEYALYARIDYYRMVNGQKEAVPYSYYRTNGDMDDGNYLLFYQTSTATENISSNPGNAVSLFSAPGVYEVTIYQASNQSASFGDTYFGSLYRFAFVIEETNPQFEFRTMDGAKLDESRNGSTINCYTNQDTVRVYWEDPVSDLLAKIKKDEIRVTSRNGDTNLVLVNGYVNTNVIHDNTSGDGITAHYFDISKGSGSGWRNGTTITVEMHLEGYTNTLAKTINIDYTAPYQNLAKLMSNVERSAPDIFDRVYQEKNMRQLRLNDGNTAVNTDAWAASADIDTLMANVSYSYTAASGTFKNYAYTVDKTFFEEARTALSNNTPNDAQDLWINVILNEDNPDTDDSLDALSKYNQTISFVGQADLSLSQDLSDRNGQVDLSMLEENLDRGAKGTYFEIIEKDRAGNLVVYIIYYLHQTYDELDCNNDVAIAYSNTRNSGEVTNADIEKDGFNIYSNTGFEITKLGYKNDAWAIYTTNVRTSSNSIQTDYYMASPNIESGEGQAQRLIKISINFVSGRKTITYSSPVTLDTLFEDVKSSENKHYMTISDRTTGESKTVYISIMDAEITPFKQTVGNDTAVLEIEVPSFEQANSTTRATIYPTAVEIHRYSNNGVWEKLFTLPADARLADFDPTNPASWVALNEYISSGYSEGYITISYEYNRLRFTITVNPNTAGKFKYVITDNFHNQKTELQLVNEEICEDVITIVNDEPLTMPLYHWTEGDEYGSTTYLSASDLRIQFNSLLYKVYRIEIYNGSNNNVVTDSGEIERMISPVTNSINGIDLTSTANNYNITYRVFLADCDDNAETPTPVKVINAHIYRSLPTLGQMNGGENKIQISDRNGNVIPDNEIQDLQGVSVNFNGQQFMTTAKSITTFSYTMRLRFNDGQIASSTDGKHYLDTYSYSVYYSFGDTLTWEENITSQYEGYIISGTGVHYILVKYDSPDYLTTERLLIRIEILDSQTNSYSFSFQGQSIRPRNDFTFSYKNLDYTTVYMLSGSWASKDPIYAQDGHTIIGYTDGKADGVVIRGNEELNTTFDRIVEEDYINNVKVEIYKYTSDITSISQFAVIYIPSRSQILTKLNYQDAQGSTDGHDFFRDEIDPANPAQITSYIQDFNRLKLTWNASNGIPENKINVKVTKLLNGQEKEVNVKVQTDGEDSYIYLTKAGEYLLSFYDSCENPNIQLFGSNNLTQVRVIFINTVPFTITYTDIDGNEVITEPVNRAIYNSAVTISLVNPSKYFTNTPILSIKKDGMSDYNGYTTQGVNNFILSEPGFYEVSFKDTTGPAIEDGYIRQETYTFSILNQYESRYSFAYSTYSNYYVKQIIKNGKDVTKWYVDNLGGNTINIDGTNYLTNLHISYFDMKTANGQDSSYKVTIATREEEYAQTSITEFTFAFRINVADVKALITVGLDEGGSTSNTIPVTFNTRTLYDILGDCIVRLPGYTDIVVTAENADQGLVTHSISQLGTDYVQILSASKNLLYSYRITRTEPLNVWTIIIIVVSVVVVAVAVFITIKLRKRLKVK